MTEAFPLHWPHHRPRTRSSERSRFKVNSFARVRDALMMELARLGARSVILSTNNPLKQDGMPYANRRQPEDQGVAIYFEYKKNPMCFACDRWDRIEDNIQAIHHTIEALRGIARWGSGDMLQAAFTGFQALPAPNGKEWWNVLEVARDAALHVCEGNYKILAMENHPDNGGTHEKMADLNAAIAQARRERGAA